MKYFILVSYSIDGLVRPPLDVKFRTDTADSVQNFREVHTHRPPYVAPLLKTVRCGFLFLRFRTDIDMNQF